MRLHYKGKYDLNPESLPYKPHLPGAVAFKEAKDIKTLGMIANGLAFVLLIPVVFFLYLRYGSSIFSGLLWGSVLSLLCIFPHELLHAICFKEDVYLYTDFRHGMCFVVGPETMSRGRFILMSLLPNLVFGFIPYIVALVIPRLPILGAFGALSIIMGVGDYYNIFNAATQMPRGARTYLHRFNSFWYMPEQDA